MPHAGSYIDSSSRAKPLKQPSAHPQIPPTSPENKLHSAFDSGTPDEETISELIANVEELGNKLTEITNRLHSNVRD